MDAPGILVSVLGLALIAAMSWLVVAVQRAALVRAELAATRSRVGVLERSQEARRRSVVALAEVCLVILVSCETMIATVGPFASDPFLRWWIGRCFYLGAWGLVSAVLWRGTITAPR